MEFNQLEQFMAIATSKTMRQAAEKLYLSQPTLSQNLKKLEAELGVPLFDRSHKKMELTSYGQILLKHCDHMIGDWHALLDALAAEKSRQASTLHVGCYSTVHTFFEMPQLATAFPELYFEVSVKETPDLLAGFDEGSYDLIIVPEEPLTAGLDLVPIDEERLYLSVPKVLPLAKRSELTLPEFTKAQFLVPSDICGLSSWYKHILEVAGVNPLMVEFAERDAYLAKIDTTMKCHFSTTLMQRLTSSSSQRVEIPIAGREARRSVCVAQAPGGNKQAARAVAFLERIRGKTYSGHAFLPFVLNRGNLENLVIHRDAFEQPPVLNA